MNPERLKCYNDGYIYGADNALRDNAIDEFIAKEYTKKLLRGTVNVI